MRRRVFPTFLHSIHSSNLLECLNIMQQRRTPIPPFDWLSDHARSPRFFLLSAAHRVNFFLSVTVTCIPLQTYCTVTWKRHQPVILPINQSADLYLHRIYNYLPIFPTIFIFVFISVKHNILLPAFGIANHRTAGFYMFFF